MYLILRYIRRHPADKTRGLTANHKEADCPLVVADHRVWANEIQSYDASTMTKDSKYSYISVSAALGVDALFAFNMTCRVVVDAASALPEHAILRHIPSGHEECFVKRWS